MLYVTGHRLQHATNQRKAPRSWGQWESAPGEYEVDDDGHERHQTISRCEKHRCRVRRHVIQHVEPRFTVVVFGLPPSFYKCSRSARRMARNSVCGRLLGRQPAPHVRRTAYDRTRKSCSWIKNSTPACPATDLPLELIVA